MGRARTETAQAIIEIEGRDRLTATTRSVEQGLGRAAERAGGIGRGLDQAGGSLLRVRESAALLTAGLSGAIGVAQQLAAAMKAGARSLAIETAFVRAAGGADAAAEAMGRLERASAQMIDQTSLQQIAIRWRAAGLEARDLARLMELAGKAAIALGEDPTEATRRLTDAIVQRSDAALKAMGIEADFGKEVQAFGRSMGVSAEQVSQHDQRLIALQTTIRELGRAYGDAQIPEQIQQIRRAEKEWADATDQMQRLSLHAWRARAFAVMGLIPATIQTLRQEQVTIADLTAAHVASAEAAENAAAAQAAAATETQEAQQRSAEMIRTQIRAMAGQEEEALRTAVAMTGYADGIGATAIATAQWARATQIARGDLGRLGDAIRGVDRDLRAGLLDRLLGEHAGQERAARAAVARVQELLARGQADARGARRGGGLRMRAERLDVSSLTRDMQDLGRSLAEVPSAFEDMGRALGEIGRTDPLAVHVASVERLAELVTDTRESSLRDGIDTLRELGRTWEGEVAGGIASGGAIIASEIGRVTELVRAFAAAGMESSAAWRAAVPGMIDASGKLVGAFVRDQKAMAIVQVLVETAKAWGSYPDPVGMAVHFLSAGLWGAVAGGAFGGGGKGSAGGGGVAGTRQPRARIDDFARGPQERTPAKYEVHVHLPGATIVGGSREARRQLQGLLGGWVPGQFVST